MNPPPRFEFRGGVWVLKKASFKGAKQKYFGKKESKKRKFTFKIVERYFTSIVIKLLLHSWCHKENIVNRGNALGASLHVGKKVKVTGANLHGVWEKHELTLDL